MGKGTPILSHNGSGFRLHVLLLPALDKVSSGWGGGGGGMIKAMNL